MKIYLAGGMKSNWRNEFFYRNRNKKLLYFLNPEKHELAIPSEYTNMDLHMIDECDFVFGYIENNNPGGYNTIFELGYAIGLKKPIIFILEKNDWNKYTKMIQESALFYSSSFQEGMDFFYRYLKAMDKL